MSEGDNDCGGGKENKDRKIKRGQDPQGENL